MRGGDIVTLAESVIAYRARHRMTQEEFARLTGYTRATIVKIESGKRVRPVTEATVRMIVEEGKK